VIDLPHSDQLKFLTDENQPVAHVTSVKEEVVCGPRGARRRRPLVGRARGYQEGQTGSRGRCRDGPLAKRRRKTEKKEKK